MKQNKFSRLFSLLVMMLTMISTPAFANTGGSTSKDYYSKATATAVGAGKVYVSYNAEEEAPGYAATSEAASGADSKTSAPTHTYFLYAQPEDGYKFDGWYGAEACEGEPLSRELNYKVSFSANSNTEGTPTTKNYFAKFLEASTPVFRCDKDRMYINIGDDPMVNDGLVIENLTPSYVSSNTAVATVASDGKVTPVAAGSTVITVSADGVEDITYVATVLDYSEAGKTQIGNSDFEDWSNVTNSNHAPNNWNSFETNEGTYAGMARSQQVEMSTEHRPGSNGLYSARIYSRNVYNITVAQGNLTLGCINAGEMTPVAAGNHNCSKISDPKKSETIDKVPVAIKVWVKFVPAKVNEAHPNARVAATVHDAHNYITQGAPQFETAENYSSMVALAENNFPACDWTELTIPFKMMNNAVVDGQLYIIVNISTNSDPGQGQVGDELYVDDIELVYDDENTFDEVPLTMSDANWATFCAPYDVNVPAGMKAYTIDGVDAEDETVLSLTEVEDVIEVSENLQIRVIKANTPVVIQGNGAASLKAYGVAAPEEAKAGWLTGVYEETTVPTDAYVLQNHDGVVGFYKVGSVQPTLKANRCYMNMESDVKAFFFNAQDAATAVNKVTVAAPSQAVYDLNGRRVEKAQKGVYIVNGKKVVK